MVYSSFFVEDHPRVGREKILEPSMGVGNFGSPPRGRGKILAALQLVVHTGITPAWAGKRVFLALFPVEGQDHPRMGGEKRNRWKKERSQ